MVTTLIDLTGQQFGRLQVIERAGTIHGQASWLCVCECGKRAIIRGSCLRNRETQSCGCLAAELASDRLRTHGMTNTRLFKIWSMMLERCYRPYNKSYLDYGGRGIEICDEWRCNFLTFHDWAVADGYSDNLTIDRIDVNGNYLPSNCRWSTAKVQANNRRNNRLITINGKTHTISEWADEYGLQEDTVLRRLKYGWDNVRAITTPVIGGDVS